MPKLTLLSGLLVSLLSVCQLTHAASFADLCKTNGELFRFARITNVISMAGADPGNPKGIYINAIATNQDGKQVNVYGEKELDNANPADQFLTNVVILSYLTNGDVQLCITGNSKRLYGVSVES